MAHLKKVVKIFSNAEVKAFPTATDGLTLLKAGETGKVLVPVYATMQINPWVSDWTNVDGVTHTIKIDNADDTWWDTTELDTATVIAPGDEMFQFLGTASGAFLGVLANVSTFDTGVLNGGGLYLNVQNGASGAFTGGSDLQVFTVSLYYLSVRVG